MSKLTGSAKHCLEKGLQGALDYAAAEGSDPELANATISALARALSGAPQSDAEIEDGPTDMNNPAPDSYVHSHQKALNRRARK